jgi:hypothetical protein
VAFSPREISPRGRRGAAEISDDNPMRHRYLTSGGEQEVLLRKPTGRASALAYTRQDSPQRDSFRGSDLQI